MTLEKIHNYSHYDDDGYNDDDDDSDQEKGDERRRRRRRRRRREVCFLTSRLMTYNSSVNNLNQSVCKTTLTARIRVESASPSQSQTTQPEMCTVVTL